MDQKGMLYFFCGKMGVGKTTYSIDLAIKIKAIYLSEDKWLTSIYPNEIKTFQDYITYSNRLKLLLKEHVSKLLTSGLSVVMDFPGNTIKQRQFFKEICNNANCEHQLIYLKADDELCLKQLELRRISTPERNKFDTKEMFYQVTSYFQEPNEEEGFSVETIEK